MKVRAMTWTNSDGRVFVYFDPLRPDDVTERLGQWQRQYPATRPEMVDVEVTVIRDTVIEGCALSVGTVSGPQEET